MHGGLHGDGTRALRRPTLTLVSLSMGRFMMRRMALLGMLGFVAACGGDSMDEQAAVDAQQQAVDAMAEGEMGGGDMAEGADLPTVTITAPLDGDTLDAGAVTVTLEAAGIEIVPVAEGIMGTAHHHIYLDEDLRPLDEPVPAIPNSIIHLGNGAATFTFEDVAPGEHRLITVMADLTHVPIMPQRTDTVFFYVR